MQSLGIAGDSWCQIMLDWPFQVVDASVRVAAFSKLYTSENKNMTKKGAVYKRDWLVIHNAFTRALKCALKSCGRGEDGEFCGCMVDREHEFDAVEASGGGMCSCKGKEKKTAFGEVCGTLQTGLKKDCVKHKDKAGCESQVNIAFKPFCVWHSTSRTLDEHKKLPVRLDLPFEFKDRCVTDVVNGTRLAGPQRELSRGSTGPDVKALQAKLIETQKMLKGRCDGNANDNCLMAMSEGTFDLATTINLKTVQRGLHLCPSGLGDQQTAVALACTDCLKDSIVKNAADVFLNDNDTDHLFSLSTKNIGGSGAAESDYIQYDILKLRCALETFSKAAGHQEPLATFHAQTTTIGFSDDLAHAVKGFKQMYMHDFDHVSVSHIVDADTNICLNDMFTNDILYNPVLLSDYFSCVGRAPPPPPPPDVCDQFNCDKSSPEMASSLECCACKKMEDAMLDVDQDMQDDAFYCLEKKKSSGSCGRSVCKPTPSETQKVTVGNCSVDARRTAVKGDATWCMCSATGQKTLMDGCGAPEKKAQYCWWNRQDTCISLNFSVVDRVLAHPPINRFEALSCIGAQPSTRDKSLTLDVVGVHRRLAKTYKEEVNSDKGLKDEGTLKFGDSQASEAELKSASTTLQQLNGLWSLHACPMLSRFQFKQKFKSIFLMRDPFSKYNYYKGNGVSKTKENWLHDLCLMIDDARTLVLIARTALQARNVRFRHQISPQSPPSSDHFQAKYKWQLIREFKGKGSDVQNIGWKNPMLADNVPTRADQRVEHILDGMENMNLPAVPDFKGSDIFTMGTSREREQMIANQLRNTIFVEKHRRKPEESDETTAKT